MTSIGRRAFLRLLVAMPPALTAEATRVIGARPLLDGASPFRFENPSSAAAIGEAYLREWPHECDMDLWEGPDGPVRWSADRLPDEATVGKRIRRDFETGDLVTLDGWMLSRTEARLCACMFLRS